jgi:hypothetical protein
MGRRYRNRQQDEPASPCGTAGIAGGWHAMNRLRTDRRGNTAMAKEQQNKNGLLVGNMGLDAVPDLTPACQYG